MATTRPRLLPCSPPGMPQPSIRSSTPAGSSSGTRSSAARTIGLVRSSARRSLSDPLNARPIGDRAVATMTASGTVTCSPPPWTGADVAVDDPSAGEFSPRPGPGVIVRGTTMTRQRLCRGTRSAVGRQLVRQLRPGTGGGDEFGQVLRVVQLTTGARLDPAQPVTDGVGVTEQGGAGVPGGALRGHPGVEGAQQLVPVVGGQVGRASCRER